jgi:hypothetical protein
MDATIIKESLYSGEEALPCDCKSVIRQRKTCTDEAIGATETIQKPSHLIPNYPTSKYAPTEANTSD